MALTRIQILLIEDNPGDVRLIEEMCADIKNLRLELALAERLSSGLRRLAEGGIDLVLLDLSLPDSHGLDTFNQVQTRTLHVPVIVLTSSNDETLAIETVQKGAQDYLVKGQVNSHLLTRSIRYAIERHRMQAELRVLSLTDELTGLRNRRGFLELVQQQLKWSNRTHQPLSLLVADVDHLKLINDTWGHREGDLVLIETANVLRATLREADIIARLGGDEFAVLLIGAPEGADKAVTTRLQEKLAVCNARGDRHHPLSLSIGLASYNPLVPCSVDELIARADARMYEQKSRAPASERT